MVFFFFFNLKAWDRKVPLVLSQLGWGGECETRPPQGCLVPSAGPRPG